MYQYVPMVVFDRVGCGHDDAAAPPLDEEAGGKLNRQTDTGPGDDGGRHGSVVGHQGQRHGTEELKELLNRVALEVVVHPVAR